MKQMLFRQGDTLTLHKAQTWVVDTFLLQSSFIKKEKLLTVLTAFTQGNLLNSFILHDNQWCLQKLKSYQFSFAQILSPVVSQVIKSLSSFPQPAKSPPDLISLLFHLYRFPTLNSSDHLFVLQVSSRFLPYFSLCAQFVFRTQLKCHLLQEAFPDSILYLK